MAVGTGNRARGVAEDGDPPRHPEPVGERENEEVVPVAAGQIAPGPVERVDRHPLVELQPADPAPELQHARVLVRRLGREDRPAALDGGSDRRRRHRQQRGRRRAARAGSAASRARARPRAPSASANTMNVRWVPIRGSATAPRGTCPTSEPAVEIAYRSPVTLPVSATRADGQAVGVRGHRPQQHHRHRDEHQNGGERTEEAADRQRPERLHREAQERVRHERDERQQHRRRPGRSRTDLAGRRAGRPAGRRPRSPPTAPPARSRSCWPR